MRQQLVDDTAVVLSVGGGVTVEVGGQQSPRLVRGAGATQAKNRSVEIFILQK